MKILITPFKTEKLRAKLADEKNYYKLRQTYSKAYPEIKDENTPNLWDDLNKDHTGFKRNPMLRDRLRNVATMISGDNLKVLNIGFGPANLEKICLNRRKFLVWHGIDISYYSVENASKKFPEGKFEVGDIIKLRYKDNYFDYVIALEVLEHIRTIFTFKALKEMFRVLKPGGKTIISVPLNEGLKELVIKKGNKNAHVRIYTPELIKAELCIAGFKIVKTKTLYAFDKYYLIKSIVSKYIFPGIRKPNNIIILAQKLQV